MSDKPDIEGIKARLAAATPGPWAWFGNTQVKDLYLATVALGRRYVMGFARWGMNAAQPVFQRHDAEGNGTMVPACELVEYEATHRKDVSSINNPDAKFIAHAPADIAALLAEVEALRARLTIDDAMVERADAAFKSTPVAEARNLTRRMLEAALNG